MNSTKPGLQLLTDAGLSLPFKTIHFSIKTKHEERVGAGGGMEKGLNPPKKYWKRERLFLCSTSSQLDRDSC